MVIRMKKDEWYEEEDEKINPWVAAGIFVGMIVLAMIICGILWSVTHKGKDQESTTNVTETVQDISTEDTIDDTEEIPEETSEESTQSIDSSETEEVVSDFLEPVPDDTLNSEVLVEGEMDISVTEEQGMTFTEIADTVTAKDVINLRSEPSTADAENIVAQLQNGETLSRTGMNEDTGWSRLEYNGQTVYAVSGYLTTELNYVTPVEQADPNRITTQEGRVIIFADCDDYVRPKHYVNLRTEPSTSQGESTVKCQITHADIVHRTGYSEDSGWSRVEFYGEVLYVVSSYVYSTE